MENLQESGKIYFFKTSNSEKSSESFGPLLEVNSSKLKYFAPLLLCEYYEKHIIFYIIIYIIYLRN